MNDPQWLAKETNSADRLVADVGATQGGRVATAEGGDIEGSGVPRQEFVPVEAEGAGSPPRPTPSLGVKLHDVMIKENRKWFGGADIRLDCLVLNGSKANADSFYAPITQRFAGIGDDVRLPIDRSGLLLFYGRPKYFLDIYFILSRDRKDSDDLATLLSKEVQSKEVKAAVTTLAALAVAAPEAAVIAGAIGAAAVIGNLAYRLIEGISGNTIGLYHGSFLQNADNFGIGRHSLEPTARSKDFSFWYEIVVDS